MSLVQNRVGCFALGAAAMYLLDPDRGERRRSLLLDKFTRAANDTGQALSKTAEYTWDRTRGLAAETRAGLTPDHADDRVICERVRSAMGRAVSHPRSIQVTARDGAVTLGGPVLAHEMDYLLRTVSKVRGVKHVENRLEVHQQPGDVPGLQGGTPRVGPRSGPMREYWDPSTRLAATLAGGGLAAYGLARGGLLGGGLGLIGAAVAARGLTNLPARRLAGVGAGRRALDVQKTINVNAPLERVFDFFSNYENFPRFMRNVREVRGHAGDRSHWVVAGPAGLKVDWDADLTDYVPDEVLAWKSVEGATVQNAGVIRFQLNDDGSTRVDIKLSYNPPGGALGHLVASLFGADPKSEMDADLARVKTFLETGQPAHDAARPLGGGGGTKASMAAATRTGTAARAERDRITGTAGVTREEREIARPNRSAAEAARRGD